jgi:multicomponent Na+:H+ antiporter subunit C
MNYLVALTLGLVVAAGTYLALSRDVLRCVIGVSLISSAVNLLVFSAGRISTLSPPIMRAGEQILPAVAANPLPQALVLTAIVIGFAFLCFSMVLIMRLVQQSGSRDMDQLRDAEPDDIDPIKPSMLRD